MRRTPAPYQLVAGQALTGTLTEIGTAGNARIRVLLADYVMVLVDYTRDAGSATGTPVLKAEFNMTADTAQDPATITTGWYGVPSQDASTYTAGAMDQYVISSTSEPSAAGPYRVLFGPFTGALGNFMRVLMADSDAANPGTATISYYEAVGGV